MTQDFRFLGLPPLRPFARAAVVFASEVMPLPASPPLRPRATACGFFRGILRRRQCLLHQLSACLATGDAKRGGHEGGDGRDVRGGVVAVQPSENHAARCVVHEQNNTRTAMGCQVGKTLREMRKRPRDLLQGKA